MQLMLACAALECVSPAPPYAPRMCALTLTPTLTLTRWGATMLCAAEGVLAPLEPA